MDILNGFPCVWKLSGSIPEALSKGAWEFYLGNDFYFGVNNDGLFGIFRGRRVGFYANNLLFYGDFKEVVSKFEGISENNSDEVI